MYYFTENRPKISCFVPFKIQNTFLVILFSVKKISKTDKRRSKTMTERENFFSIIKRTGYERMPVMYDFCPYLKETCDDKVEKLYEEIGFTPSPMIRTKGAPVKDNDTEKFRKYYDTLKEGATIDIYGVANEPGSAAAMHMTHMRHPLENMETLEELQAYPFPEFVFDEEEMAKQLEANNKLKAQDKVVCGNMQCTIWETSWYMRGMEVLMMDMMSDDEMAEFVLDKVTQLAIDQAVYFVKTGADVLYFGDDIGMQRTIMMSEELYCTWLKPRLKKVVDAARAINPDVIIFYHSCGFIEPFIDHLIDVGIDVLNPVQPECMDFKEIHDKYGDRISFHGTIGTQTTMPFGTPEEVRAEVFKNLDIAGKKGGLLVAPTHLLEPEVPWENIKAYIEACHDYTRQ